MLFLLRPEGIKIELSQGNSEPVKYIQYLFQPGAILSFADHNS